MLGCQYFLEVLRELRSVVGLQELLDVIFGIQDFTVNAIVRKVAFVAVVLRGATADTEFASVMKRLPPSKG